MIAPMAVVLTVAGRCTQRPYEASARLTQKYRRHPVAARPCRQKYFSKNICIAAFRHIILRMAGFFSIA
jgi:hypothetical protein